MFEDRFDLVSLPSRGLWLRGDSTVLSFPDRVTGQESDAPPPSHLLRARQGPLDRPSTLSSLLPGSLWCRSGRGRKSLPFDSGFFLLLNRF